MLKNSKASENVCIFGKEIIDKGAIEQLYNCINSPQDIAVLNADAHYGYAHPIGGAIAYSDHISVSGVGFDIACGNKAVQTPLKASEVDIISIMDEIYRRISFGIGRINNEPVDHEVLDLIAQAEFKPQRELWKMASQQLGTVGAGNHFVDLFADEDDLLWVGVHFGSRGFGHRTTTGFLALAQGLSFTGTPKQGPMNAKPVLLKADSALGQDYIQALDLAGKYAYAGRDLVVDKVLEILGTTASREVHNHHNFAWREQHFGKDYWVVRKGCTPAFPGQQGFIGANMRDFSVIIEGVDTPLARKALFSTVHGAGRVMSRTQALGKVRWRRRGKKRVQEVLRPGLVDFNRVKNQLRSHQIQLRGGGADEAPQCYKNLEEVLAYQGDTIKIKHRLRPIGVAMAGSDVYDPFKD
ncbi:MAG: RtcB family protein [Fibrobacter sp.]|nr:RtcB family protein [Fibrobacter sp.]